MIEEREAELVRTLYGWLIDEQMTIRQMLKRLNAGPWRPRSGRPAWSPSMVQHIRADPVYTGTADMNRYDHVPAQRPRSHGPYAGVPTVCRHKPHEQWIAIPVPAIDRPTAEGAQAQLARNARSSCRHNTRYNYLLRWLLTGGRCGLAMFGRTSRAHGRSPRGWSDSRRPTHDSSTRIKRACSRSPRSARGVHRSRGNAGPSKHNRPRSTAAQLAAVSRRPLSTAGTTFRLSARAPISTRSAAFSRSSLHVMPIGLVV